MRGINRTRVVRRIADKRLVLAVLAGSMALTAMVSGALAATVAEDRRAELDRLAQQARTAIERRVASYAEPLYGMNVILSGAQPAGRADFHRYVELAGTSRRQPGLVAYTFNRLVPAAEAAGFEEAVRADTSLVAAGYPGFRVHPGPTAGADRVVIDFAEPWAGNERILGFDVTTDPLRWRAVEAARDSGGLVASAPLKLVQQSGAPGFVLFLPVYRTAQAPATAPARRRHFAGVVAAAVDVKRMLAGVTGGTGVGVTGVDLRISDVGATLGPRSPKGAGETLVLDSDRGGERHRGRADSSPVDLNVGGRRWRLIITPSHDVGWGQGAPLPWVVGIGGGVLSMLLAGLVASLSGSKQRAVALAAGMTTSLRRQEDELRRANLHLAESNTALARADRSKDAFLGTMSHELRTPLTAITGFASLLEARWERLDAAERQESLSRIVGSAATLGQLVDDLLEFNRTGDDAPALSLVPLDLGLVAQQVVDELGPLSTTHHFRLDTTQVLVLADRVAVARILTNLLTNAVKFSPARSTVTVTIGSDGGRAVLEVADEGLGVPPDERALVFERFYRCTQDGQARRPGTGIGLAVVKDLAERMGGSARVDAPTGRSVFRVELPLAEPSPPGDGVAAAQPGRVA